MASNQQKTRRRVDDDAPAKKASAKPPGKTRTADEAVVDPLLQKAAPPEQMAHQLMAVAGEDLAVARAQERGEKIVIVNIPKTFELNIAHGEVYRYNAGTARMPESHVDHWWAKANKVTVVETAQPR